MLQYREGMTQYMGDPSAPGGQPPVPMWQPPRPASSALKSWGIVGLIIGPLLLILGSLILVAPFGLFILGGGGNTGTFVSAMSGFFVTGGVFCLLGIAILVLGIVGVSVGSRKSVLRTS